MQAGKIHIGTSGWSYKNWPEFFYPKGVKTAGWLTYYASVFDTTEINSSFYGMPRIATVENWAAKVPEHFKFCPKMSRYLTHLKKLREPEDPLQRFFDVFDTIKQYVGPVLVQLPATLQFDAAIARRFFDVTADKYRDYDFVLEVRHDSWMTDEAIAMMKEYKMGFVISQSGVGFPYAEIITAQTVYVRFHGPKELYASSYGDDMLMEYAAKFKMWMKQGLDVWAFFNNTMYSHGVDNARRLLELMNKK